MMIEPVVIDTAQVQNNHIGQKVAIFVNLYYVEKYEWCMDYLLRIPKDIDLYISSSNEDLIEILKKDRRLKDSTIIIEGVNRGRDIGALLVTFRKYILKYDLICFVHDKKSKDVKLDKFINMFEECLWDNLLSSENHIKNIIDYFYNDKNLGALMPPLVAEEYSGMWHCEWGKNYDNTIYAAKLIGLSGVEKLIEDGYKPSSYGTCFWARTKVLKKLFDYSWKYTDFSPEPAPIDYSLTHAIERLIEIVVVDSGSQVKNVFSVSYAQKHINFIQNELLKYVYITHESIGSNNFIQDEQYLKLGKKICKYKRRYIYGAGKIGQKCYKMLTFMNIKVEAYVVSERKDILKMDIPVILPTQIEKEESIVIIGMADKNEVEKVRNALISMGILCFSLLYD